MTLREQINDIWVCITRQDELYDICGKRSGMTPSMGQVLYTLDQFEVCTQGEIAKLNLLPKQTVHTVTQELEKAGYLEKISEPGRKEKPLRLTESGKRYAAEKLSGLYRAEERAARLMGEEQFRRMAEQTRRFTDAFEQEVLHGAE